jgi:hypothetical protein
MKFVAAEIEKNPNYQPPDDFIKVFFRIKSILDELRPIVQAKLQERALLKGGLPA